MSRETMRATIVKAHADIASQITRHIDDGCASEVCVPKCVSDAVRSMSKEGLEALYTYAMRQMAEDRMRAKDRTTYGRQRHFVSYIRLRWPHIVFGDRNIACLYSVKDGGPVLRGEDTLRNLSGMGIHFGGGRALFLYFRRGSK